MRPPDVPCVQDGYVWEEGPNSYQPGDAILTVACDAGMQDDILLADPNSDRYVLWDKELRALPKDIPTAVLGTFLTWPGKIRAGLGAIGGEGEKAVYLCRAQNTPSPFHSHLNSSVCVCLCRSLIQSTNE